MKQRMWFLARHVLILPCMTFSFKFSAHQGQSFTSRLILWVEPIKHGFFCLQSSRTLSLLSHKFERFRQATMFNIFLFALRCMLSSHRLLQHNWVAFYCGRSQSSAVQSPRSEDPANISGGCRVAFCHWNRYNYSMKICERKHPNKPELLDNTNDYIRELVDSLFTLCLSDLTWKVDAYNAIFPTVKGPEIIRGCLRRE